MNDWIRGLERAFMKVIRQNWLNTILSGISIAAFITIWWLVSAWFHGDWPFESRSWVITAEYIPYPWVVIKAFFDSFNHPDPVSQLNMWDHVYASMKRITFGFVLACAAAVPLGLLMGRSRKAEAVSSPELELFRPIPPLAWVPIFTIALGFLWGPIVIVFMGIFFPLLLSVRLGAKSVDPLLIDAARTLGANRLQIFMRVVLPYTTPYLMTGIKVGLGIGWMCIVAAEMLGAVGGGVGWYIWGTAQVARYDLMYAGMVTIGVLSILTTGVAGFLEQRLYKWMGTK